MHRRQDRRIPDSPRCCSAPARTLPPRLRSVDGLRTAGIAGGGCGQARTRLGPLGIGALRAAAHPIAPHALPSNRRRVRDPRRSLRAMAGWKGSHNFRRVTPRLLRRERSGKWHHGGDGADAARCTITAADCRSPSYGAPRRLCITWSGGDGRPLPAPDSVLSLGSALGGLSDVPSCVGFCPRTASDFENMGR